MSVFIIGGDRLGSIAENLKRYGVTEVRHITGRKKGHTLIDLPENIDLILVLTDFVSHCLAAKIKEDAGKKGKKVLFARRSWSHIAKVLEQI